MNDRVLGGLVGLLVGDALGVPYEFRLASELPQYDLIEYRPPVGFQRSWPSVPPGTYSDDGAQALVLLNHLNETNGMIDPDTLTDDLIRWMNEGYMSIDKNTFDVGNQTRAALSSWERGHDVSGLNAPAYCGNGSLMRSLPVALRCYSATDDVIIEQSLVHSAITHPYIRVGLTVALYTLTAAYVLRGETNITNALAYAITSIDTRITNFDERREWKNILEERSGLHLGSGYVVDSFWSAVQCVTTTSSYEQAVKHAVMLGGDTDTTACIAGGLAGILYGYNSIPVRWVNDLRVDILTLQRMVDY